MAPPMGRFGAGGRMRNGVMEVRKSPAVESMPSLASLPEAFREAFFGGLEYAIIEEKFERHKPPFAATFHAHGPLTTPTTRRIFANILISQWFAGNWPMVSSTMVLGDNKARRLCRARCLPRLIQCLQSLVTQ